MLEYRRELGRILWAAGVALVAVSTVVQMASLAFWLPLELYQMQTMTPPTFVVWLRLENIVTFRLGKMDAWGLATSVASTGDAWDYVHITTWNFLPFLLRRVGVAPRWVVDLVFVVWSAGLVTLAATLSRLRRVLGRTAT